ncbi:MAG: hypothetical protein HDR71_12270 [Lachnospiraceae bacterium]|nr:hypothetical protein [Lachnospiraceae bacterium]
MKTCRCDKCKTIIPINIQEAVIDPNEEDNVIEQFFVCHKCGARYTICIYDNFMRKKIAIREKLSKSKYDWKRSEKLQNEMRKHLEELKVKYNR